MNVEKTLKLLLLILFLAGSVTAQPYSLTAQEVRNIALAYDSLDECREVNDSLQVQISNALTVIQKSDTLILTLKSLSFNQSEIISGKDILLKDEKRVAAAYRNRYRLWKAIGCISLGFIAYLRLNGL